MTARYSCLVIGAVSLYSIGAVSLFELGGVRVCESFWETPLKREMLCKRCECVRECECECAARVWLGCGTIPPGSFFFPFSFFCLGGVLAGLLAYVNVRNVRVNVRAGRGAPGLR